MLRSFPPNGEDKMGAAIPELLRIFDKNLNPKGIKNRTTAHKRGLLHQGTHCWIIRPNNKILIQRRSSRISGNPGLLDVSAGGHMVFGETLRDSGREVKEELGLRIPFEKMTYLGNVLKEAKGNKLNGDPYHDKEIVHIFFMYDDTPLDQYKLQEEEVDGIFEMDIDEGLRFFAGKTETVKLEGYKRTDDGLVPETLNAKQDDFTLKSNEPWIWILARARLYVRGRYENNQAPEDENNLIDYCLRAF